MLKNCSFGLRRRNALSAIQQRGFGFFSGGKSKMCNVQESFLFKWFLCLCFCGDDGPVVMPNLRIQMPLFNTHNRIGGSGGGDSSIPSFLSSTNVVAASAFLNNNYHQRHSIMSMRSFGSAPAASSISNTMGPTSFVASSSSPFLATDGRIEAISNSGIDFELFGFYYDFFFVFINCVTAIDL